MITEHDTPREPSRPSATGQRGRQILAMLLLALAGGVTGYLSADVVDFPYAAELGWPAMVALFLASAVLGITLHELGHAAAGRAVGFRLYQLAVGPLQLYWTPRGLAWRLRVTPALLGGMAVIAPLDDRDLRRRDAIMIAGGPAANLLTAALCFVALAAVSPAALADTALRMLGLMSLVLMIVALIPMRAGGLPSDGMQLLRLAQSRAGAGRATAVRALYGLLLADVRPREWDAALVARAAGTPDGSPEAAMGALLAFTHALDRGEVAEAGRWLDALLADMDQLGPYARPGVLLEAAAFTALHRGDAAAARSMLDRAAGGQVDRHDRMRAEAAVLLAEGDVAAARRRAEEGLRELAKARHVQSRALDEAWLREVLRRAGG